MSPTYHKIPNLPFYSPDNFINISPLTKNRSSLYSCQHKQTKQNYIIKEVPYTEHSIQVYEILMKLQHNQSIVNVKGVCKMVVKIISGSPGKKEKNQKNKKIDVSSQSLQFEDKSRNNSLAWFSPQGTSRATSRAQRVSEYLLVFMEKYDQTLLECIMRRRKQRSPFKQQQVSNFLIHTLYLLQTLERQNLVHRDIKPQNFMLSKGRFKLCDFENAIIVDNTESQCQQLDLTTVEFTSPQFFRNLKQMKNKVFDPFKLDVYALGVTLLCMCSLGQFDLTQRKQYLLENSVFHKSYIKDQRRRYVKNVQELKNLNPIIKMMLQQDEYKRDTFITLAMKIKPMLSIKDIEVYQLEEEAASDYSRSEESRKRLKNGEKKKIIIKQNDGWDGVTLFQRRFLKFLVVLSFILYALILAI